MGEANGNTNNNNGNGQTVIERNIRLIERLGMSASVVVYFLYKDWVFSEKLVAALAQVSANQDRITEAIQRIAEAVSK